MKKLKVRWRIADVESVEVPENTRVKAVGESLMFYAPAAAVGGPGERLLLLVPMASLVDARQIEVPQ